MLGLERYQICQIEVEYRLLSSVYNLGEGANQYHLNTNGLGIMDMRVLIDITLAPVIWPL